MVHTYVQVLKLRSIGVEVVSEFKKNNNNEFNCAES